MVPTVPPSNIAKIRSRQFIRFMYIYIVKIRSKQFLTIYVFLFCLVKNRAGSEPLQKLDFLYSKKIGKCLAIYRPSCFTRTSKNTTKHTVKLSEY